MPGQRDRDRMPQRRQIAVRVHAEDGRAVAAPVEQVQPHAVDFEEQIAGSRRRHRAPSQPPVPESMSLTDAVACVNPATVSHKRECRGGSPLPGVSGGVPLNLPEQHFWVGGREEMRLLARAGAAGPAPSRESPPSCSAPRTARSTARRGAAARRSRGSSACSRRPPPAASSSGGSRSPCGRSTA